MILKNIIKSKGFKQKWLADRMGVSEVTFSSWVKEKSFPSKKHLEKLCEILDIPVKDLTN